MYQELGYKVISKLPDHKVLEIAKAVHTGKKPNAFDGESLILEMQDKPIEYARELALRDLIKASAESKKQNIDLMEYVLYHLPADRSARVMRFIIDIGACNR